MGEDAIDRGLAALEGLLEPPPAEPEPFIGIGEVALPPEGLQLEGTVFDPEAVGSERLSPSATAGATAVARGTLSSSS